MIDYIKIMNLIIAFIKLTPIPIDVNKLLNDSEVITINLPILPKINLTSNMMSKHITRSCRYLYADNYTYSHNNRIYD